MKKRRETIKKSRETMRKSRETMLKSRKTAEKHRKAAKKSRKEARKKAIEALEKSRLSHKEHSKKIREALVKAEKSLKKSKLDFTFLNESGDITINGKKVKITKKIIIKVPKGATFNLNTRHCKVKLPNTTASGKVSYGSFNAGKLNGGDLNISYSPVFIEMVTACNLFLNNVTDAKIASVTNSVLNTNSSGVNIVYVNENVEIINKFGELSINNITKNFKTFKLDLNYSDANINLSNVSERLSYNIDGKSPQFPNKPSMKVNLKKPNTKSINGSFVIASNDKNLVIKGKYTQLSIKK